MSLSLVGRAPARTLPGEHVAPAADAGLRPGDSDRLGVHCLAGASYGTGAALVAHELPMLIDFRDVYWTPEG